MLCNYHLNNLSKIWLFSIYFSVEGGGGLLDNALKNTTNTGSPLHSEKLKMAEKIPCLGKHREFGNFCHNTHNFVCLGPRFIDYKEQGFFNICGKIPPFFRMCLPSQFCIIMNILKSLKLRSDGKRREFEIRI